jgi:hypothetical protein
MASSGTKATRHNIPEDPNLQNLALSRKSYSEALSYAKINEYTNENGFSSIPTIITITEDQIYRHILQTSVNNTLQTVLLQANNVGKNKATKQ